MRIGMHLEHECLILLLLLGLILRNTQFIGPPGRCTLFPRALFFLLRQLNKTDEHGLQIIENGLHIKMFWIQDTGSKRTARDLA